MQSTVLCEHVRKMPLRVCVHAHMCHLHMMSPSLPSTSLLTPPPPSSPSLPLTPPHPSPSLSLTLHPHPPHPSPSLPLTLHTQLHESTSLVEGMATVLEGCNTVCLLYDQSSPESFRHAVELYVCIVVCVVCVCV